MSVAGRTIATLFCSGLAATQAAAQTGATPEWQVFVSPYVWIAGVSGELKAPALGIPARQVSAGFHDILSHLNAVPVMGSAELRIGRFGLTADIIALSVGEKFGVPGPYFAAGKVELSSVIGSAAASYRALATPRQSVDVGLGLRAFGLSATFRLQPGLLPGQTLRPGSSWVAPIVSARTRIVLAPGWSLTVYGDVGSAARLPLTWQVLGTVDWQVAPHSTVRIGYRHLRLDYGEGPLRQSTTVSGPLLAATVRF